MPKYHFICDSCQEEYQEYLSPKEFLALKKEIVRCEECFGVLLPQIIAIHSSIEKSPEQIKIENQEENRKILEKIEKGDSKTITDIYGETPNLLKK